MNNQTIKNWYAIRVVDRTDMDAKLSKAEAQLKKLAPYHGKRGILITRHSPWEFTLELHRDVPFGTTLETHAW